MNFKKEHFGRLPDGRRLEKITIENSNGYAFSVIPFGATLTSFRMPDAGGKIENIALGFDTMEAYLDDPYYLGATVGRYANRIANGKFSINGSEYVLSKNDGDHHLHGGVKGLSKVVWAAERFETRDSGGVTFSYTSPDGEENYPGNLNVTVTYMLNMKNELFFKYTAETDKETPVNLTNHAYWNLQGTGKGTILDHLLTLNCSRYLSVTGALISTGELLPVKDTPMDFKWEKRVGDDIQHTNGGYDHCFVINESSVLDQETLRFAARLFDPISGRGMTVFTDLPGVQLYTGNFLDNVQGMQKEVYSKHSAMCLETEHFPDAVNHAHFPTSILKPGKRFESVTMHRFSV